MRNVFINLEITVIYHLFQPLVVGLKLFFVLLGVGHDELKAFGENFELKTGPRNEMPAAKYAGRHMKLFSYHDKMLGVVWKAR